MNLQLPPCMKVRLTRDLTHYHPDLVKGSEGYTIGVYGHCSLLSAHYTGVWFPGIQILDVDSASLEAIAGKTLTRHSRKKQNSRSGRPLSRKYRE